MKKIYCLLFSIITSHCLTAQQGTLLASAKRDSSGVFIGDMHATEQVESVSAARQYAIINLKKDLEGLDRGSKNTLLADAGGNERNLNSEIFATYLARLDKKYKGDVRSIETDNIRDIFQIDQKSEIKKRHSSVISAQCFSNKNDGRFIKMKDLDGEEIIGFPLESFKGNSRYGLVENYHQGFARIKKDQVFGFLNYCGDETIPCQYEKAEPFNDGKALVKKFDWYFVDVYGNESEGLENIVDAKALRMGVNVAKFKNGKYALIDNNYDISKKPLSDYFDEIVTFNNELFRVKVGKNYGLIKIDGSTKIDAIYDDINATAEQGKWMIIEQNKKVGLMDTEGNIKIKPSFESIVNISIDPTISNNSTLGIARDEAGIRLIDFKDLRTSKTYSAISDFNKYGLAQVKDGKYVGFINLDLKVVIEPVYSTLGNFNQYGLVSACKTNLNGATKCGYIKYDGTEIIPIAFDEVAGFNRFGLVVAKENVKNCSLPAGNCRVDVIYDKNGNLVIGKTNEAAPIGIKYATTDTLFNGSFIAIKTLNPLKNGDDMPVEYNLVERNGLKRITTQSYLSIKRYDANLLFPVMKDGKWGLIDTTGKIIAKPTYKDIMVTTEGLYGVKYDNNKYGFIDKKGKVQVAFDYDEVRPFNNGLSIVSRGQGKLGVINRFNAKIAPCFFSEVNILPATKQFELLDSSGNKFVLNSNGDCVTNCTKFDEIRKLANQ
ncbi:WG repeat-containing protein [Arcicella sp. LKC2W]|uniref:WG repeat-containing protein n=1 Tax=Arcicella sp. LKC2W TaxID=2984198 RepID=UPI002B209835|nr:WG repeat-containing protein [Arcicella sp. LKC2W]MEA5460515.1 WG repeat-containing protein [Arcicella sp. LKC2W]